VSADTPEELEGLRAAGQVVARTIAAMRAAVAPGVTTAQLDAIATEEFERSGARSGPQLDYDFPGTTCISVNDEAVHGVPGSRTLRDGDLVKLDVTAELHGFYADACVTVPVGDGASPAAMRLVSTAERALARGLRAAVAGARVNAIGAAVQETVELAGHSVCVELHGHGIGRRIHEPPDVPNYADERADSLLTDGLVITVEPIIAAGAGAIVGSDDGWTVRTVDGSLSAHFEHTIVVRDGEPLVLTALAA
jgi:methionyl aminopeptidase